MTVYNTGTLRAVYCDSDPAATDSTLNLFRHMSAVEVYQALEHVMSSSSALNPKPFKQIYLKTWRTPSHAPARRVVNLSGLLLRNLDEVTIIWVDGRP